MKFILARVYSPSNSSKGWCPRESLWDTGSRQMPNTKSLYCLPSNPTSLLTTKQQIFLDHRKNHFDIITSGSSFLGRSYWCLECKKETMWKRNIVAAWYANIFLHSCLGITQKAAWRQYGACRKAVDPNDIWLAWKTLFLSIVYKHVPIRTKRVRSSKCPWVTPQLKKYIFERDKLKKKATITNDPWDWTNFKKVSQSGQQQNKKCQRNVLQQCF